ncbi:MAG: IS30 family transposase, partial [Selenomonadaceae bacterium]|nr:IS30 family transposase [Selenomonadaceae bacterium]
MSYKHLSITERELIAIYRELAGNGDNYLPSKAQTRYKRRRKKCRPHKLLEKPDLFKLVKKLFLELQLSPEQKRSTGNRGAIRHLRHRGKPRRPKGYVSNRGKIPIGNELSARPVEALERSRFG